MHRISGYFLAGGESRRFGSDKARAHVGGRPLLSLVVEPFLPYLTDVTVVARTAEAYADLGFKTIGDYIPGQGPIGGLHRALIDLEHRQVGKWLLLCSCDLLGIRPSWIERLVEHRQTDSQQAVAFRGEHWEPMPALYHLASAPFVNRAIQGERRALWRLLDEIAQALPLPEAWDEVIQINTPQQLWALHEL